MENNNKEVNQTIEDIKIHEIIILSKKQKTGDDGEKLGYNFYQTETLGVVIRITKEKDVLEIKTADGEIIKYEPNDTEKEYYYQVSRGSEILFQEAIAKAIKSQEKMCDEHFDKLEELEEWEKEFKNSISLLTRIARYFKGE